MNEIEKIRKIAENQGESQTPALTKKISFSSKQWDLAKKSTQASSHINYEVNQTQTSLQNIYGENKFKIQYEIANKEDVADIRNEKRFSKFEVKIDHRKSSRIKSLSAGRTSGDFNFKSQFIEIKSRDSLIRNNNYEAADSADKFLRSNNSNNGFSHSAANKPRKDAFGVLIRKKAKKHKVSFLDLLQQKTNNLDNNNNNNNNTSNKINTKGSVKFLGLDSKNKLSVVGNWNNNNINNNYNFLNESENKTKEFVEVIKIESYKKYYLRVIEEDNRKVVCSPCGCNIF